MLNIGLGHPRFLLTDLNLIVQIITLVIILISLFYKNRKKFKVHGATMGVAVILHVLSFVSVMGLQFYNYFQFYSTRTDIHAVQTAWLHVVPGGIALLLGIFLIARWAIQVSNVAGCYKRKRIMDLTLALWLFSLVFGIATYVLYYF